MYVYKYKYIYTCLFFFSFLLAMGHNLFVHAELDLYTIHLCLLCH